MITVSSAFIERMKERTNFTLSADVTFPDSSTDTLTDGDFVISGNKVTDSAGGGTLPVGNAICRTIELEIANFAGEWDGTSFDGAEIELHLSYDVSSTSTPQIEEINLGTFTVKQQTTSGHTIRLVGMDDMVKADTAYLTSMTFPQTATAVFLDICTRYGVDTDLQSIPNGTYTIQTAPSSELTARQILGYLAMLSGGNARVNRDRKLEIVNYDFDALDTARESGIVSSSMDDLGLWKDLEYETEDVEITGVQTSYTAPDGQNQTILVGTLGNVLTVANPLFDAALIAPDSTVFPSAHTFPSSSPGVTVAVGLIGDALIGATYRPFSGSHIGYPIAEFGDVCRITDGPDTEFYTILTDVTYTLNSFADFGTGSSSVEYSGSSPLTQKINAIYADILEIKRLKADIAEIGTAIIQTLEAEGINADDVTITGALHSTGYLRTSTPYADRGFGIELGADDDTRIAAANFAVTPAGWLYARAGKIAEATLARTSYKYYTANLRSTSPFINRSGQAGSYTYDETDPARPTLIVHEEGTAYYVFSTTATYDGSVHPLNKIWCRCTSGGNEDEEWPTPTGRIFYLDSNGNVVHESEFSALRYFDSSLNRGNTFTISTEYIQTATTIRLEVDLAEEDTCRVQRWYGLYNAIYYGTASESSDPSKLKGAGDGVYFGTDGISVGEEICFTPDGHGAIQSLTAGTGVFNKNVSIVSSGITDGVTPSANTWGTNLGLKDSTGGKYISAIQPYASSTGQQGVIITGFRTVSGTRRGNSLYLLVDSSGNPVVSLNKAAWQSALGISTTSGTYTPTIAWSSSGSPTVASGGSYQWIRSGNVMMIHGRFNITALNAPSTAGQLTISLPSGISVVNSVAAVGALYTAYAHDSDFVGRVSSASGPIQFGTAAAVAISGAMQTGWHNFHITVFVT